MITLSDGTTTAKIYNKEPLAEHYASLGFSTSAFDALNQFTYACLPEGSSGKFLVRATDAGLLTAGAKVSITIQGQVQSFNHYNLHITSIKFISVPLEGWTLNPTEPLEEKLAVITVEDLWAPFDSVIQKDYNRVTIQLPESTSNTTEPVQASLSTYQEILEDIVSDHGLGGGAPTVELSGLPNVKPHNLLFAGSSVRDAFQIIADANLLVAYAAATSPSGKVLITNDQTTTDLIPSQSQVIYSNYGCEVLPANLITTFSQQGNPFSKQRTAVLEDYYANFDSPWASETDALTGVNDPTLANNGRFQNSLFNYEHYYPYYETGVFQTSDANTATIAGQLATNLIARQLRHVNIVYKDVVLINPSMTIQKITYKMTPQGLVTHIESTIPRKLNTPPMLNHVGRGLEFVPPMLTATVASVSASDPLGGHAPGSAAEFILPDVGNGALTITGLNASTQQTFEGDAVHIFWNFHYRRYEYTERLIRKFQYYLLTNWVGGLAIARRYSIDGVNSGKSVLLRDPKGIFAYQHAGDSGYMFYSEANRFYAFQADCDAMDIEEPPETVGACMFSEEGSETLYCFILDETSCDDWGGSYQGDGITCP